MSVGRSQFEKRSQQLWRLAVIGFAFTSVSASAVTVRYGVETVVTKNLTGATQYICGVETFGSDPLFGTVKSCYINGVRVAGEGELFWTSSPPCQTTEVWYGANDVWAKRQAPLGRQKLECSHNYFGDPLVGVLKYCRLPDGRKVASHGVWGSLSGVHCPGSPSFPKVRVSYGLQSVVVKQYPEKTQVSCSIEEFKSDPAVGTVKSCYIGSTAVASEGGKFWTSPAPCSEQMVWYGANGVWAKKRAPLGIGQLECSHNYFGDPLVGVVKHCQLPGENGRFLANHGVWGTLQGTDCVGDGPAGSSASQGSSGQGGSNQGGAKQSSGSTPRIKVPIFNPRGRKSQPDA